MTDERDLLRIRLDSIHRKSDMLSTAHACRRDHYGRWSTGLSTSALVLSAFLLLILFASEDFIYRTTGIGPDLLKWIGGLAAAVNFSMTLVLLSWGPAQKGADHARALRHYTEIKYKIRSTESDNAQLTPELVRDIEQDYIDDFDLPKISDRQFNKLKRKHSIKVAVSKELDRNPHDPIWLIRIKLWMEARRRVAAK